MTAPRRLAATLAWALSLTVAAAFVAPGQSGAAPGPGGSTVLTLAPAFRDLPSNWLRGELFAAPNVTMKVPYNNFPGATNTNRGADKLDEYLHDTAGPKIVLGHSQGAQVIDAWLRRYGPSSDIDPATVQFVLTATSRASTTVAPTYRTAAALRPTAATTFPTTPRTR